MLFMTPKLTYFDKKISLTPSRTFIIQGKHIGAAYMGACTFTMLFTKPNLTYLDKQLSLDLEKLKISKNVQGKNMWRSSSRGRDWVQTFSMLCRTPNPKYFHKLHFPPPYPQIRIKKKFRAMSSSPVLPVLFLQFRVFLLQSIQRS